MPLLYLSAFFEHHRQEYYDHLLAVSQKGSWDAWLRFFLGGVGEQARDAIRRAKQLQDLQQEWRKALQKDKSSMLCLEIADYLFERPVVNSSHLKARFGSSLPTVLRALRQLEKLGIIKEVSGRARNQQFIATAILNTVELM